MNPFEDDIFKIFETEDISPSRINHFYIQNKHFEEIASNQYQFKFIIELDKPDALHRQIVITNISSQKLIVYVLFLVKKLSLRQILPLILMK